MAQDIRTVAVLESLDQLRSIGSTIIRGQYRAAYVIDVGFYVWRVGDQSANIPNPNWEAPSYNSSGSNGAWEGVKRFGGTDAKALPTVDEVKGLNTDGNVDPEHATDSGTDTYDSATNTTVPSDGVRITRDFQSANTTTTPSLDSKTITDRDGNALWAGAINGVHELKYASGTDTYLLLDPRWMLAPFWAGHIDGLELSNNSTDSDHDIDIATGVCSMRDGSGNRKLFELTSSLTKKIDADWSEGTDSGGFPSGLTLASDTEYNFFVIGKDDGSVDAGFDTDTSASNLLSDASNYSWFRRVLSVFTDGSSNILGFRQFGEYVWFKIAQLDVNDSSITSGSTETITITVPPNQIAIGAALGRGSTCDQIRVVTINADDSVDSTLNDAQATMQASGNNDTKDVTARALISVNGSSQISYQIKVFGGGSETADRFRWATQGWIDDRGRNT